MSLLRAFFREHRRFTLLLVALALCMKALVPAGYMFGPSSRLLTVEICADATGSHAVRQIAVPMNGKSGDDQGQHGKADSPCAYSALAMAALSGADVPLLAIALAFILAMGFLPVAPAPIGRSSQLRPPLRGPPALA